MKLGVCYYPEQWPAERWAEDARQMRAAGLDIVRIGEFAWALMEPAQGRYAWSWLDQAIDTLAGAGLQVVLGTPTATPPAWLTQAHPDVLRVDADGTRRAHGSRRHYCPNQPRYRQFSRAIVEAMAGRYGQHPAVIGWQIDNEFGGGGTTRCYCQACAHAFQAWLQEQYGTLDALNEAWGALFWSQTYSDWAQIQTPGAWIDKPNPSQALDFARFSSDSLVAYQQEQVDILRRHAPGRFITHNFMGLFTGLEQFDLAAPLDMVTWDSYPTGNRDRWGAALYGRGETTPEALAYGVGDPAITGMAHDLMRGLKQAPFWVMEQQAGYVNWGTTNPAIRPQTIRLWTWHAAAAGAEAVVYFRWRASLLAHEQYHSGLLKHDATPDVGSQALALLQSGRLDLARLTAAPHRAPVALLWSYDDLWALEEQPHHRDFGYLRLLFVYYRALQRLGVTVDVVRADGDLGRYAVLLAPTLHLAEAALARRLTDYVTAGGSLLVGVRSGFKTPTNRVTDEPLPGPLRALTGARVTSWQALPPGMTLPLDCAVPGLAGEAGLWAESWQPEADGVEVWGRYRPDQQPALIRRPLGAGQVISLGWFPTPAQAEALLTHILDERGVRRRGPLPPGLIAIARGPLTVWLNFSAAPLSVPGRSTPLAGGDVWLEEAQ